MTFPNDNDPTRWSIRRSSTAGWAIVVVIITVLIGLLLFYSGRGTHTGSDGNPPNAVTIKVRRQNESRQPSRALTAFSAVNGLRQNITSSGLGVLDAAFALLHLLVELFPLLINQLLQISRPAPSSERPASSLHSALSCLGPGHQLGCAWTWELLLKLNLR